MQNDIHPNTSIWSFAMVVVVHGVFFFLMLCVRVALPV
jgi:hypothetical protein